MTDWVADAAFGIVLGSCEGDVWDRIVAATKQAGGSAYLRRNDGTLVVAAPPENERKLLERLKQAFDPHGRLAPLPWEK